MSRIILLLRTGLIRNVSNCYISTSELQTLPRLLGSSQMEFDLPKFYLPDKVPITTDHEVHQLQDIIPSDAKKLDNLTSQITARRKTFDVDSLIHIHKTSLQQERHVLAHTYYLHHMCRQTYNIPLFPYSFPFMQSTKFLPKHCFYFRHCHSNPRPFSSCSSARSN